MGSPSCEIIPMSGQEVLLSTEVVLHLGRLECIGLLSCSAHHRSC